MSDTESNSLPSLPINLEKQLRSPQEHFKPAQSLTMKKIDSDLNSLRRENFDLKLRLYFAHSNKGLNGKSEADPLILQELASRDHELNAYKKELQEKKIEINILTRKINDISETKDLEIKLIQQEKENITNELVTMTALCKAFISHLAEVKKFWTNYLKNGENDYLLDSFNNWLNTSQDLLNSASMLITDDLGDSLRVENPQIKGGFSSLGLLNDLSQFMNLQNFTPKQDKNIQTKLTVNDINSVKKKSIRCKNASSQTDVRNDGENKTSQTELCTNEKMVSTDLFECMSKMIQTNVVISDKHAQTENILDLEISTPNSILSTFVSPIKPYNFHKEVEQYEAKSNLHDIKNINNKNEDYFKLPDEFLSECKRINRRLKDRSIALSNISEEKEENVTIGSDFSKVEYSKSKIYNNDQKYPLVIQKMNSPFDNEMNLQDSKINEIWKKQSLDNGITSQKKILGEINFNKTIANDESLRAYITVSRYQLLRGNINRMEELLNNFDILRKSKYELMLETLRFDQFLTPFVENMGNAINSSKNLCGKFVIEDEDSLLMQLNKMKTRKENIEKAITRQLKKTDKLLRKAKINLREN